MKRIFKRCSSLTLALLILLALCATAFAASVTYGGLEAGFAFAPGSAYTASDLFENFKGVVPGDVLTGSVTFTNAATDCDFVRLYFRAESHDAQENPPIAEGTGSVEEMNDFLSKLMLKVYHGEELIFNGPANEASEENVFLGVFRTDESATLTVELSVPVELDNTYAARVGEVDWVFLVEAYNESQLSVRKVWSDGNANHADDSITVWLLKDGEFEAEAILNAENGWAYTFDRLVEGHTWTVEEVDVPEGYTVSYDIVGTSVTITNTKDEPTPPPEEPLDLIVKKVWSNDSEETRPEYVTVSLYDGAKLYDTVRLSEENGWMYHWEDLSAGGNWQIVETNIPKGYTPKYGVVGNVITVTNTYQLEDTGIPYGMIALFGGAGLALVVLGAALLIGGRKRKDA